MLARKMSNSFAVKTTLRWNNAMRLATFVQVLTLSYAVALGHSDAKAQESNPMAVFEKRCPEGQRADDFPAWEYIANNAKRTADEYAAERNPMATFILAEVDPVFQAAGDYAGEYLVKLVMDGSNGTSFAMLKPNFPFCADPAGLDDSRLDLFTIVVAKHNGQPF